jgi:MFS family permease
MTEAGKYLGYTQFSTSLAQIIAPILGGPVIDLFQGERIGYNIVFVLALLSMMLGMLTLVKVKEKQDEGPGASG